MIDKLTIEKWRAEFCIAMAREYVDLGILIRGRKKIFLSGQTQQLWRVYRVARLTALNLSYASLQRSELAVIRGDD